MGSREEWAADLLARAEAATGENYSGTVTAKLGSNAPVEISAG